MSLVSELYDSDSEWEADDEYSSSSSEEELPPPPALVRQAAVCPDYLRPEFRLRRVEGGWIRAPGSPLLELE